MRVEAKSAAYPVFTGLYLTSLLIRDVYRFLKKAGRIDMRDTWLFAVVFASMQETAVGH